MSGRLLYNFSRATHKEGRAIISSPAGNASSPAHSYAKALEAAATAIGLTGGFPSRSLQEEHPQNFIPEEGRSVPTWHPRSRCSRVYGTSCIL